MENQPLPSISSGPLEHSLSSSSPKVLIATQALQHSDSPAKEGVRNRNNHKIHKQTHSSDTRLSSSKKIIKAEYYSRMHLPPNELEEDEKRVTYEKQLHKFKHIYHDDNFIRHSSALTKPKKIENGNMYYNQCQRLWLPSQMKHRSIQKMWETSLKMPEDVVYMQVQSSLRLGSSIGNGDNG